MRKFAIITDTTSDLEKEYEEKLGIIILSGHIILPDKSEIPAFTEWKDYTREGFYEELKNNPNGFLTSPPNIAEYQKAFMHYASEGYDILALTISGAISGAYSFMLKAAEATRETYPEVSIRCIDTRMFGPSIGLLAFYAAEARNSGRDMNETADYLEKMKSRIHQAGWIDDLSFVAKKGRMSRPKAFLGTLAGIKALGEFDDAGLTTVIAKVSGTKKALNVVIEYIRRTIEHPEEQSIFIATTNRHAQAKALKELIVKEIQPKEVIIKDVFPACGINIGPGLMASYYYGKPRSQGLKEETELIDTILNERGKS